jgi:hypothetical protein
MIVHDLDITCAGSRPAKADSKLVIDANTVLSGSVTLEFLEAISRWDPQVSKPAGDL